MDFLLQANSSSVLQNKNMGEIKNVIANITTISGSAAVVVNWNASATFVLILTGIIFNTVRIYEITRKRKEEEDKKD